MSASAETLDRPVIAQRASTLARRPKMRLDPGAQPGYFLSLPPGRDGWLFARRMRAARRGAAIVLWTLPSMLIQALFRARKFYSVSMRLQVKYLSHRNHCRKPVFSRKPTDTLVGRSQGEYRGRADSRSPLSADREGR